MFSNVQWSSLLLLLVMLISSTSSSRVELIHRDSQSLNPTWNTITKLEKLKQAQSRSKSRARWIQATLANSEDIEAQVTSKHDIGEYLMELKLGTPPQVFQAIVDTGSDLVWLQCDPCQDCHYQKPPFFSPAKSSSYSSIPCGEECQLYSFSCRNGRSTCSYNNYLYGDNSSTSGNLASETITFTTKDGGGANLSIDNFVFGCSHTISKGFNETQGLVGLGQGHLSLVTQLKPQLGAAKFSYCLTGKGSSKGSPMFLGSAATSSSAKVDALSNIVPSRLYSTYYFLDIQGISVGGIEISGVKNALDAYGGAILDSGTTLTYLVQPLYEDVKNALLDATDNRLVQVSVKGMEDLICFDMSSKRDYQFPSLTFKYTEGETELPLENYLQEIDEDIGCFTIESTTDISIIGNLQQQNYHIVYDLDTATISFQHVQCDRL